MTPRAYRVVVRPRAERDIRDAARWYNRQRAGLGEEFVAEVESTIARAAANPLLHARLMSEPEVRRVLTSRFPYRIFFVRGDEEIVVFRVLHGARHDREWKSNIPRA